MKTIAFLVVTLASSAALHAQTVITIPAYEKNIAYDSIANIPVESLKSMIDQTALVINKSDFQINPFDWQSHCDTTIIGRKFNISGFKKNENNRRLYIQMASGADTIYYELSENSVNHPNFITMGHYDKQTMLHVGKTFNLRVPDELTDINTGEPVLFCEKDIFTCTGSAIVNGIPSFILTHKLGRQVAVPMPNYQITSGNSYWMFNVVK